MDARDNIESKLIAIFEKCSEINFDKQKSLRTVSLFGADIDMMPRELVQILFEIESEFEISIPDNKINSGEFITFDNIMDILLQCIT